jgi:hypothetical protein
MKPGFVLAAAPAAILTLSPTAVALSAGRIEAKRATNGHGSNSPLTIPGNLPELRQYFGDRSRETCRTRWSRPQSGEVAIQ